MDIDELRLRGNNLYSIRDYIAAIDVYTQALEKSPSHAIILGNRSACYLAVGKPEKAEFDARLAISIEPSFVKCYFRLATALKARNAFQEAIQVIELGLIQDPQSVALKSLKKSYVKMLFTNNEAAIKATKANNITLVKHLVEEMRVDINTCDDNKCSLLYGAAQYGYFDLVEYFVEKGQFRRSKGYSCRGPFHKY